MKTSASRLAAFCAFGVLLGCAHVERQGDYAYFGMFSVRPNLQGAGVGNALLAECERIAREEWRCASMRMTVIGTPVLTAMAAAAVVGSRTTTDRPAMTAVIA